MNRKQLLLDKVTILGIHEICLTHNVRYHFENKIIGKIDFIFQGESNRLKAKELFPEFAIDRHDNQITVINAHVKLDDNQADLPDKVKIISASGEYASGYIDQIGKTLKVWYRHFEFYKVFFKRDGYDHTCLIHISDTEVVSE